MKYRHILIFIFLSGFHCSLSAAEFEANIGWADVRQLGVPISGQVKKVMSAAGSYVNPGDTMLSISCGIYKAKLKQHQAVAAGLMPSVETVRKEKELADELFDRTVLSEIEHRNAELLYIKARSQYEASLAEVDQDKIRVSFCDLKADRPLLVLEVHVMEGEMYSLESIKPVLVTVASRNTMLATSKQTLPLKKIYRAGLAVKVDVAGKKYKGRLQSVVYQPDNSVLIKAIFDFFDPRLFGNKTAKIIIQ